MGKPRYIIYGRNVRGVLVIRGNLWDESGRRIGSLDNWCFSGTDVGSRYSTIIYKYRDTFSEYIYIRYYRVPLQKNGTVALEESRV